MITDATRDAIVDLLKEVQDEVGPETIIGDDSICPVFDSVLEHIMLSEVEEAMTDDPDSLLTEDTGSDADSVFAHEAMHWAFNLGYALARRKYSDVSA